MAGRSAASSICTLDSPGIQWWTSQAMPPTAQNADTTSSSPRTTWAALAAAPALIPSRPSRSRTFRMVAPRTFLQQLTLRVCLGPRLPPNPGVHRNSLNMPGYKDLDLTLAKAFAIPKAPVLGENANIEMRIDAYNLFNNMNFNENQISKDIGAGNFGTITSALAARVVTLGIRFSF